MLTPHCRFHRQLASVALLALASANLADGGVRGSGSLNIIPQPLQGQGHFITALCQDSHGAVWVGTEGEGLFRYSPMQEINAWQHFSVADGLGDDSVYALACDRQGRIWAGHLNHGVTVWNGQKWQGYEAFAGVSRKGTLNGPLGERIFHITVAPEKLDATIKDSTGQESSLAGSVWMCTNAGLSAYLPATDHWAYLTKADGLPSNQANSVAFAGDGTMYVATQCDGLAIGSPKDHYQSWKQITSPDVPPTDARSEGLPTNLTNDVLVAGDGVIYVATAAGLAWSADSGKSWTHLRGADVIDKVKNRAGGPPANWQAPPAGNLLSEDYITFLAEGPDGRILVGHRGTQSDWILPQAKAIAGHVAPAYATMAMTGYVGAYGGGLNVIPDLALRAAPEVDPLPPPPMPSGAANPTLEFLRTLVKPGNPASTPRGGPPPHDPPGRNAVATAALLGQDWATQGNWVDRYGKHFVAGAAMNAPFNYNGGSFGANFALTERLGDNHRDGDKFRNWLAADNTPDPRALQYPMKEGARRPAQWNDHGDTYPRTQEGPNLMLDVLVPAGTWKMSLYFLNWDGHGADNALRDFDVTVKAKARNDEQPAKLPILAHARVKDFYGGLWLSFYVNGGTAYTVKIDRNYSLNAICSGVFFDAIDAPGLPQLPEDRKRLFVIKEAGQTQLEDPANIDAAALEKPVKPWLDLANDLCAGELAHPESMSAMRKRAYLTIIQGLAVACADDWSTLAEAKCQIELRKAMRDCYDAVGMTDRAAEMRKQIDELWPLEGKKQPKLSPDDGPAPQP